MSVGLTAWLCLKVLIFRCLTSQSSTSFLRGDSRNLLTLLITAVRTAVKDQKHIGMEVHSQGLLNFGKEGVVKQVLLAKLERSPMSPLSCVSYVTVGVDNSVVVVVTDHNIQWICNYIQHLSHI